MSDWLRYYAAVAESGHPIDGDLASQIINEVIFERPDYSDLDFEICPEAINVKPVQEEK